MDNNTIVQGIASKIMVCGVGGAGGNAVDHIHEMGIEGVNLMICNTDIKALNKSKISQKVMLGDGTGAGNDPAVGADKTRNSTEHIREIFLEKGTEMLFLAAGMGGGTGTGASPIIAQVAQELNILTVAIVTIPDPNEGPLRSAQAKAGVEELSQYVDALITVENSAIGKMYGNLPITDAYDKANDVVALAAKGIAEIITVQSDLVSVDIKDVRRVLEKQGYAVMGVSQASGDNRVIEAIDGALNSPLFGDARIYGSKYVLMNLATSSRPEHRLKMDDVNKALEYIQLKAATRDDEGNVVRTDIIWGTSIKEELEGDIEIVVVAAGFDAQIQPPFINQSTPLITEMQAPAAHKEEEVQTEEAPEDTEKVTEEAEEEPKETPKIAARDPYYFKYIKDTLAQPAYIRANVPLVTKLGKSKNLTEQVAENNAPTLDL